MQLLNNASFSHAVLLSGALFEERQSFALSSAKKLLCVTSTACGKCTSCVWLLNLSHPDLLILPKEDKTAIKIEDIRFLQQFLNQTPHQGKCKIAILLKSDSMPIGAMNALLKTLEEPPRGCYLFLLSEYPHLLTATVRSRCQKIQLPTVRKSSTTLIDALMDTLRALKKGVVSPFESAQKWQTHSLIDILDGLYYCLTESKSWHKNLFFWQDALNALRRQVLNKQNPNHLLALEYLFYQWVKLYKN